MESLFPIVLFVIGVLMLFKPELLWKLETFFAGRSGEQPTPAYIKTTRIVGAACVIVVALSAVWQYVRAG